MTLPLSVGPAGVALRMKGVPFVSWERLHQIVGGVDRGRRVTIHQERDAISVTFGPKETERRYHPAAFAALIIKHGE